MNANALKIATIALAMIAAPIATQAAEVTVLVSNNFRAVMEVLASQFEKTSGHKLVITYGSTNPLKARIEKGEVCDLAILSGVTIDDLIKQDRLVATTRAAIARSGMGVAIRKGAPKPNLGTAEAFKQALINAKSIAFLEQGITGVYLKGLFQRLDIAEVLKSKIKYVRAGEAVAEGEAEIGITQISEILPVAGVELAGPLPSEIQSYATIAAAVGASAKQVGAAKALLMYLALPEAASVITAKGMEPAPAALGGQ